MLHRLAVLFALTLALPSAAYDLRHDSTGALVRWSGRVEFVLDAQAAIHLRVTKLEQAARAALATLSKVAPDVTLALRVGASSGLGYLGAPAKDQNDLVVLTDWPYSDAALAATIVTVNAKTHEIVDADIAFNASNNQFGVLDETDSRQVNDVQNTLTHELGHAMGLLHNAKDATVVMYPSAPLGEVSKRTLADDDAQALEALYAVGFASEVPPPVGCSATGADASLMTLALVAMALLGRGRRLAWVLVAMPALAANPPGLDLSKADEIAVGFVVSARSSIRAGLFFTELEVAVSQCHAGECGQRLFVTVPGGKVGDLEQTVVDHPVPAVGEPLAVTREITHLRVHRLADAETRARFETALLMRGGSQQPQRSPTPRAPARNQP